MNRHFWAAGTSASSPGTMKGAIFLDRDGTINEDVGPLFSPDKLRFISGSLDALHILQTQFSLFIVTNQSAIGDNLFSMKDFEVFNGYYQGLLRQQGIDITRTYCCPHSKEDNCFCRKPQTYFLKTAALEFGINLKRSYVIGDHPCDIEMGCRVSAKTIYLLSGHGKKHLEDLSVKPDFVAPDLSVASEWLREDIKHGKAL